MSTKRKIITAISWTLVAVCMGIIFYLSHQPATESAELSITVMGWVGKIFASLVEVLGHDHFRSLAHALEYCGLGLLLFNALYHTFNKPLTVISFAAAVFYAATDEIHQIFIEGRAFQLSDIAVDAAGAFAGVIASYVIYTVINKIINHRRGKKN